MIRAIQSGHCEELQPIYKKAEDSSRELIADFQSMIRIIESLSKDGVRILKRRPLYIIKNAYEKNISGGG